MLARAAGALFLFALTTLAATDLRLLDAVKRRDHNAVITLLRTRLDVNAAQPDGATALAWAAYLDDTEIAEKLLDAGAKPNTADEYGETPLTLACANGDAALVGKLLAAGADVTAARWDGETALMIAAGAGSVDAVNLLVAHGANLNAAETRKGQTALMWAAAERHPQVVKALVADGADVRAVSKRGFTALVFAAVKNDRPSAETLLAAGADPNYTLSEGLTVLSVAASYRSEAVANLLADRGANPNASDRQGDTPLEVAANFGELTLVQKLLAKGANVNARTAAKPMPASASGTGGKFDLMGFVPGEQTPLMLAAKGDHVDVMRALVRGGADAKLKAQDGTTVLTYAVASGHLDAVQYAYELNPDVKVASTVNGLTLMHKAVLNTIGRVTEDQLCEVIRFLAAHGALLDELDARGKTPLYYANQIPIDKAVTLLHDLVIQSGGQLKINPPHH
jgi:uncharacterized protein